MALRPETYQFISQLGLIREIDATTGPAGPNGVTAYWLVPTNGWFNGSRFSNDVETDLSDGKFDKTSLEGLEYYRIPEESSNLPGRLSHYAQLTGLAELQNPPGGGVNRVVETFDGNASEVTVAPESVSKFVDETDSFEEQRKHQSAENQRLLRQVTVSPAREPSEGKLVASDTPQDRTSIVDPAESNDAQKAPVSRNNGTKNADQKNGS